MEENFTPEQQQMLDDAQEVMRDVLDRLKRSTKQYGMSYTLANVPDEIDEELLDLPGWLLMETVRLRQALRASLPQLRDQYLAKFLKHQKTAYLHFLQEKISEELAERTE